MSLIIIIISGKGSGGVVFVVPYSWKKIVKVKGFYAEKIKNEKENVHLQRKKERKKERKIYKFRKVIVYKRKKERKKERKKKRYMNWEKR